MQFLAKHESAHEIAEVWAGTVSILFTDVEVPSVVVAVLVVGGIGGGWC